MNFLNVKHLKIKFDHRTDIVPELIVRKFRELKSLEITRSNGPSSLPDDCFGQSVEQLTLIGYRLTHKKLLSYLENSKNVVFLDISKCKVVFSKAVYSKIVLFLNIREPKLPLLIKIDKNCIKNLNYYDKNIVQAI